MRPKDEILFQTFSSILIEFDKTKIKLVGIENANDRESFVEQILDSIRRIQYLSKIKERPVSQETVNPSNDLFDPIKGAILKSRDGDMDEAFWLIFLSTYFGKHLKFGWAYVKFIYGKLGTGLWNWENITSNVKGFREWLDTNKSIIKSHGVGFGNHRKYESLDAYSPRGTGSAVESYVNWVSEHGGHLDLIEKAYKVSARDPYTAFDHLFTSMNITSFGRTGRFDYLTTIGNIGLANIEPKFAYLKGATGPLSGAKLLFSGNKKSKIKEEVLEKQLAELDLDLKVGKQVLEDALCNWQKNPGGFEKFRG